MESMNLVMKYNNMRAFIADELRILDSLEEMTKEEYEIYKKNPTVTNALKLAKGIDGFASIKINNGSSTVYFKFGEDPKDIIVLKTIGPASSLSNDEIIQEVKNELKKPFEEFAKKLVKNDAKTVDLDSIVEQDNTNNNLSTKEKISELEKAKEELLAPQTNQENIKNKSLKN